MALRVVTGVRLGAARAIARAEHLARDGVAVLLGIFWIINGTTELFLTLSRRDMAGRGWTGVMGAFSIVAGLMVLADPVISLLTLAIVLGVWLLVFGAMETTLAVRAMSFRRHAGARTTAHAM